MAKIKIPKYLFEDMSLTMTKDGHLKLRKKPGPDSHRVKTESTFKRTRENAKEFGTASKAMKLLRQAFTYWINKLDGPGLTGRMMKAVLPSIQADSKNAKGKRNLLDGKPELLEGFRFNARKEVRDIPGTSVSINKDESTATIQISPFYPDTCVANINRNMYCRVISICGMIDMVKLRVSTDMQISDLFSVDSHQIETFCLTNKIRLDKGHLNFLAVGIEFCYKLSHEEYPVAGGSNDPLTIIKVIRAP